MKTNNKKEEECSHEEFLNSGRCICGEKRFELPKEEKKEWEEEETEQAGRRIHLLLYSGNDNDPQYVEWRADLETAIFELVSSTEKRVIEETIKEIINELETNPNTDGSTSPNLQHWIEMKQIQLKKLIHKE